MPHTANNRLSIAEILLPRHNFAFYKQIAFHAKQVRFLRQTSPRSMVQIQLKFTLFV